MTENPKGPLDLTTRDDAIPETMALDAKLAHDQATTALAAQQKADVAARRPAPAPSHNAALGLADTLDKNGDQPEMKTVGGKASDWIAQAKAEVAQQPQGPSAPAAVSEQPRGGALHWLIALLLVAALGAGGWWYWATYLR